MPLTDRTKPGVIGDTALLVTLALVVALFWTVLVRASDDPVPEVQSRGASQEFFADYVTAEGRVIRHDQGGDTVSEGQAYALGLALGDDDAETFDHVWSWTRDNLQLSSGLFAWQWQDGAVTDHEPVADADLDVAVALARASDRFDRSDYADEARRIAAAVLDHETVDVGGRLVLVAGPWAVAERIVNPSYLAPCADEELAAVSRDPRWLRVRDSSASLLAEELSSGLPSDWAILDAGGGLLPIARPEDRLGPARYSLDAARLPARLWGCNTGRALTPRLWERLEHLPADGAYSAYTLDGAPLDTRPHPLGLIAGALTAGAAGDPARAGQLIGLAARLERALPSYYGAAWLGLAEDLLATISVEIPEGGDNWTAEDAADGSSTEAPPTSTEAPPAWWPMIPADPTSTGGSLLVTAVDAAPVLQALPTPAPPHPTTPVPPNPPPVTTTPPSTTPPTTTPPTTEPPTTEPPTTEPPTTEPPTTEPPTTEPPTTEPPTTEPPPTTSPPGG